MIYYITSYYLQTLISESIERSIDQYRWSKNTIYFDGDSYVADQENKDFIFSSPYFSDDLKEFLYYNYAPVFIGVSKDWFSKFIENVYLWSQSQEWLYYDVQYICDPSLNKYPYSEELDLSPHNKAVFHCKKYF